MKKASFEKVDMDNAHMLDVSASEIRAFLDGGLLLEEDEEFNTALDSAQGSVFTGEANESFVVIRVIKGE